MKTIEIAPAYGRTYNTTRDVLNDWYAGKDFRIIDKGSRYFGAYINKEDAVNAGYETAKVTFGDGQTVNVLA